MNTPADKSKAPPEKPGRKHWLYRSENLPWLWVIQIVILILAGIPAALYVVHVHYLPLDLLAGQALDSLGLGGLAARFGLGNG